MENEPKDPLPFRIIERFFAWYIAKWWNPLIFSGVCMIISIVLENIAYMSRLDPFLTVVGMFYLFTLCSSIAAIFTSFLFGFIKKRWLDFCLLFLTSIVLAYGYFYIFISIACFYGDCF